VDYTVWGVLQQRGYREKIQTVEELQQNITEEWERLDQRVIDKAVKQWRKGQTPLRYPVRRQVRSWSQTCSELQFGLPSSSLAAS